MTTEPNNKQKKIRAQLLVDLRKQKIKSLRILYSGSGDEGNICNIERCLDSSRIPRYAELEKKYWQATEDLIYSILEDNFGGWEINEGSNGIIHWDMKDDTIKICHNQMVTESIYEEREGL